MTAIPPIADTYCGLNGSADCALSTSANGKGFGRRSDEQSDGRDGRRTKATVKEPAGWCVVTVQRALWGLRRGTRLAWKHRSQRTSGDALWRGADHESRLRQWPLLKHLRANEECIGQRNSAAGRRPAR